MSGTSARSYRPGSWFAVAGERALVLLPPAEKARVAALWELIDDGAGFDVTLDALIAGGLRDLPTFALIATEGGRTEVVIRGQAAATFVIDDEETVVNGAEATTWAERTLTGVTRVSIQVEPDPEEGSTAYVVSGGVFRVSRIDQSPESEPLVRSLHIVGDAEPGEVIAMPALPATEHEELERDPEPDSEAGAEPDVESHSEPASETEAEFDVEAEVEPEPEPEAAAATHLDLGDVPESPSVPAAPILPPLPPGFGSPTPAPPPATSNVGAVVRLAISDGQTIDIDGPAIIGRAPEAKTYDFEGEPVLLTVPSPHMEISSAHLQIAPGDGEALAIVTDLGSTNGTVVVQPGVGPADLAADEPLEVQSGSLVDIGDGVTIQISRAEEAR